MLILLVVVDERVLPALDVEVAAQLPDRELGPELLARPEQIALLDPEGIFLELG